MLVVGRRLLSRWVGRGYTETISHLQHAGCVTSFNFWSQDASRMKPLLGIGGSARSLFRCRRLQALIAA